MLSVLLSKSSFSRNLEFGLSISSYIPPFSLEKNLNAFLIYLEQVVHHNIDGTHFQDEQTNFHRV